MFEVISKVKDNNELVKNAAVQLCKIVEFKDTDENFKESLVNNENLKPLFESEYYDKSVLNIETNILEAIDLDELCFNSGFAFTTYIQPG